MPHQYDLFISHASEDKDFVRPLANSLRASNLRVWYDEFELKPGMGLRESIDRGLTTSSHGLVVLSTAFFAKSWPRWELDGLVQLVNAGRDVSIIPLWLRLDRDDVLEYSPSLANIVAVRAAENIDEVSSEVLRAIRPELSVSELAQQILRRFGFEPPPLSSEWWLDAAGKAAPVFGEGTFQSRSSWGPWGFPLPELGETRDQKAERLAWGAMQDLWQRAAREARICQATNPATLLSFLDEHPGLAETAECELDFTLCYAPQLGIPGHGGFLEPEIRKVFDEARLRIKKDPTRGAPGWMLCDEEFFGLSPESLTYHYFWPMDPAATAPDAPRLSWIDAYCWLTSSASNWIPSSLRALLREGLFSHHCLGYMVTQSATPWLGIPLFDSWREEVEYAIHDRTKRKLLQFSTPAVDERLHAAVAALGLPETGAFFADAFREEDILGRSWEATRKKKRRKH